MMIAPPRPRRSLPSRRRSVSFNFWHDGLAYHCTASRFPNGRLAEIFLSCAKAGSTAQQHAETAAIMASLLLQLRVLSGTVAAAVPGTAVAKAIELAEAP